MSLQECKACYLAERLDIARHCSLPLQTTLQVSSNLSARKVLTSTLEMQTKVTVHCGKHSKQLRLTSLPSWWDFDDQDSGFAVIFFILKKRSNMFGAFRFNVVVTRTVGVKVRKVVFKHCCIEQSTKTTKSPPASSSRGSCFYGWFTKLSLVLVAGLLTGYLKF